VPGDETVVRSWRKLVEGGGRTCHTHGPIQNMTGHDDGWGAAVLFLFWAFLSEASLQELGVTYYPECAATPALTAASHCCPTRHPSSRMCLWLRVAGGGWEEPCVTSATVTAEGADAGAAWCVCSKYWAVAVPTWICVTVVCAFWMYEGCATPALASITGALC
jgi:hypothetical protein